MLPGVCDRSRSGVGQVLPWAILSGVRGDLAAGDSVGSRALRAVASGQHGPEQDGLAQALHDARSTLLSRKESANVVIEIGSDGRHVLHQSQIVTHGL